MLVFLTRSLHPKGQRSHRTRLDFEAKGSLQLRSSIRPLDCCTLKIAYEIEEIDFNMNNNNNDNNIEDSDNIIRVIAL